MHSRAWNETASQQLWAQLACRVQSLQHAVAVLTSKQAGRSTDDDGEDVAGVPVAEAWLLAEVAPGPGGPGHERLTRVAAHMQWPVSISGARMELQHADSVSSLACNAGHVQSECWTGVRFWHTVASKSSFTISKVPLLRCACRQALPIQTRQCIPEVQIVIPVLHM